MQAHSVLPPSGAKSWVKCPMWVTMNTTFPQGDTEYSLEGTAAHECFMKTTLIDGELASNGVTITDEMVEGATLFLNALPRVTGIHFEERVSIKYVHDECFGTPDAWWYDEPHTTLHIYDYKFGHRYVDEYENEQCIVYAIGILGELKLLGYDFVKVEVTIVQPRCFYKGAPVRTWKTNAAIINSFVSKFRKSAELALDVTPESRVNDECEFCPGRHACNALQLSGYKYAELSTTSSPDELNAQTTSAELKLLELAQKRLSARISGLQAASIIYLNNGEMLPFHKLEPTPGRKEWSKSVEEVTILGNLFGVELTKPALITPTQALKLGVDESVITEYSRTKSGGLKLVQVDPKDAQKSFSK
jgi:hypothetical protein